MVQGFAQFLLEHFLFNCTEVLDVSRADLPPQKLLRNKRINSTSVLQLVFCAFLQEKLYPNQNTGLFFKWLYDI